ncbi:MAG: single-stranded DNA-binding protein [Candidatus Nealsonbacteria bacterium]|nr:single-stranded DNA-binding protein [Candidatus Nealsonbacteria bacterium]
MNLNKAFLIGRLTRDPETKSLPSGQPVTSFGMATDRFYYDKSGGKQQKTEFHNIVIFGKLAEVAAQYLLKGSLAYIEGRIQNRTWKDQSGNQKYRSEIIAERMQLGPKSAKKETSGFEQKPQEAPVEEIPIIEEDKEIDVKDIPF